MSESNSLQNDNVVPIVYPDSPFKLKKVTSFLEVLQVGAMYERLAYHGGSARSEEDLVLVVRDMRTGECYSFVTTEPIPTLHFQIDLSGAARKATPAFKPFRAKPKPE